MGVVFLGYKNVAELAPNVRVTIIFFHNLYSLNPGVGRVSWAFGLKEIVLDSTEYAPQFESCYLHFEKNFLGQRFTPSWAHPPQTVINL